MDTLMSQDTSDAIHPGDFKLHEGKIVFDEKTVRHTKLAEARTKQGALFRKMQAATDTITTSDAFTNDWTDLIMKDGAGAINLAEDVLKGKASLNDPKLNKDVLKKVEELFEKHAPAEFGDLQEARKTITKLEGELHGARAKAVKQWLTAEGRTPEEKTAAQAFVEEADKMSGVGFFASRFALSNFKENFGLEGFKRHKLASAFKAGTAVVGLGIVFDAVAHGERKGPGEGDAPVQRGFVSRLAEGAIGLALAGGAAFHGRR